MTKELLYTFCQLYNNTNRKSVLNRNNNYLPNFRKLSSLLRVGLTRFQLLVNELMDFFAPESNSLHLSNIADSGQNYVVIKLKHKILVHNTHR